MQRHYKYLLDYKYLLVIISAILILCLMLLYSVSFGQAGFWRDTANLIQQVIPNLVASLLVFLVIYIFIERVFYKKAIEFQTLNALATNAEASRLLFEDHSAASLQRIIIDMKMQRDSLKSEISQLLDNIKKANTLDERMKLDSSLRNMYIKLNDVDLKVTGIEEKLAISTKIDLRDEQIRALSLKIQQMQYVIDSHKATAKTIVDSAKQF